MSEFERVRVAMDELWMQGLLRSGGAASFAEGRRALDHIEDVVKRAAFECGRSRGLAAAKLLREVSNTGDRP